jgi:hypothetical protein
MQTDESRGRNSLTGSPARVGALFVAAYLVLWAGHMDNGDSSYRIAWARSMLLRHTARIDDAGLGVMYAKYSIGHSLLAMPFLAVSELVKRTLHFHAEGPLYMLLFVLNAAVFLALVARYLRLRFGAVATGRTLLVLGFCTVWLPCSRMDSVEQLVLTFLFAGFLAAKLGRPITGMLLAGCSIIIRPDSAIPVALLGLWVCWPSRDWRLLLKLALACLPALLVNAAANWVRWGTWAEAGYAGEPFSEPFLAGIYGLLFSAGKSIFLYSPPLVLGVIALVRHARGGAGSRDYWFFASVLCSEILFYSCWWDWSGEDCWAVRFLNPGVMLMSIPCVELLKGLRFPRWPAAIAIAGLAVQMLAVLVDPLASDYAFRNFNLPRVALFTGKPTEDINRIDISDLRFNPHYSPLATNWLMLRVLAGHPPALETDRKEIARTGTPLYNALIAGGWNPRTVVCDLFWVRLIVNGNLRSDK